MNQRQANINLQVLKALRDLGVCSLEELSEYHGFIPLKPSREEMVRAVLDMNTMGYTEQPIPGDNDFYKVTEKGLHQVNKTAKLDPAVWGRQAI